jgi:hypothetical protein
MNGSSSISPPHLAQIHFSPARGLNIFRGPLGPFLCFCIGACENNNDPLAKGFNLTPGRYYFHSSNDKFSP